MKNKRKITRRAFLKRSVLTLLGVAMAGGTYTRFIEPNWLEWKRIIHRSTRLPEAFQNLRIIHFSDLHFGYHMNAERLASIVEKMNEERADLILFTGDLIDNGQADVGQVIPELRKLHAPLGKFAVLGNHDFRHAPESESTNALEQAGFRVLKNQHVELARGDARIAIAGLEDWFGGFPNVKDAVSGIPTDRYTILLAHEPDLADEAMKYAIDLQLSGHSHGGQVRIPGLPVKWNPEMGQKYPDGLYTFTGTEFKLYTNRGLGMTFMPIRLFCRPEITIHTIRRQAIST